MRLFLRASLSSSVLIAFVTACNSSPSTVSTPPYTQNHNDASTPQSSDGGSSGATPDAASPPVGGSDGGGSLPLDSGSSPPGDAGGSPVDASTPPGPTGALVLYASGYGPDISMFPLDASSGALGTPKTTPAFSSNPSFLAFNRAMTHLYAVDEDDPGQVGAYSIDKTGTLTFQNAVASGGDGPPFLGLDRSEAFLLVANYDSGHVAVVPVKADGSLSAPTSTQVAGKNAHMILTDPSNHFAFVPCLGSDYVAQYVFDATKGTLTANMTAATFPTASGAGPRHIAFHPNGKYVYLLNETNSTMSALSFDSTAGTLSTIQTVSMLPTGFTGANTAAEVWVHPSGAWVLGSNRGNDSIVAFTVDQATGKMSAPVFSKSGGNNPRDFTFDPSGSFVFAANQGTTNPGGAVAAFTFNATTGALTAVGSPVPVTGASFVGAVHLAN